jgi:hypothetical protein
MVRHGTQRQEHAQSRSDLAALDGSKLYVVWGSALPFEAMYPVFGSMAAARKFRWYGLGVMSLAPFATAHWAGGPGGLAAQLVTGEPLPFFATKANIEQLATYCAERRALKLQIANVHALSIGYLYKLTCRGSLDK